MTLPNTMSRWCSRCGMPEHGSAACRYDWPPTVAGSSPPKSGWTCPVCGTGCAPWLPTHCDKQPPKEAL